MLKNSKPSEDTRVKIPALVHFLRLGYTYLSLKEVKDSIHKETNIFIDIFRDSINRINDETYTREETLKIIEEINIKLANDDLGEAFYKLLINGINGCKIIDFADKNKNKNKNQFHVVTELAYQNGDDGFRPDIVTLLNGLPLAFIEVKKPNNLKGILAERERINKRFQNNKFKKFVNITQLLVFSNNMEYDTNDIEPIQGAFYGTSSYNKVFFNSFREENEKDLLANLKPINESEENFILKDNNLITLKGAKDYELNKEVTTPTNRIITSLFMHERYLKLLKYAIVYVHKTGKDNIIEYQKHIMRYPQFFATLAIENSLDRGIKKGVIWHTQGSGKTALSYYNVKYLTDYFQKKHTIAKFYFVVDRLALLEQAMQEFLKRGLKVESVNSREDFIKNIRRIGTSHESGEDTIAVVNIQKFSEESITRESDYDINIQRIYFLDEAHRSYNPKGSFLANLIASDRNAIIIALTGTPLISKDYKTKDVFGDYFHKYYYNMSIADGYTLKLIREGIKTEYRAKLNATIEELEVIKGQVSKQEVYAHPKFVSAMLEYITEDFNHSKIAFGDDTIGAMIVCDSSEQARSIFTEFKQYKEFKVALILHDEDDKDTRKKYQEDFKDGKIDFLIVFNMLLTGFDAPRLKKLYLGRIIKKHNLLQTLTRVNRPYKNFHYGYVVDFADIRKEFDKTNREYFKELQEELGDSFEEYSNIFKSQEEIEEELAQIKEILFSYDTENAESFSREITVIDNKQELQSIRKALENYKSLYNIIKLYDYQELIELFDLENINFLYNEVNNRINIVNLKENLQNMTDNSGVLNCALDEIDFTFTKITEEELVIADAYKSALENTRKQVIDYVLDPKSPEYITLLEELKRIFAKKNIEELTAEEMQADIKILKEIEKKAKVINQKDARLCQKYENDVKFMRAHKRILEQPPVLATESVIHKILITLKHSIDTIIEKNQNILENQSYFSRELITNLTTICHTENVKITISQAKYIQTCIANEYFAERKWVG